MAVFCECGTYPKEANEVRIALTVISNAVTGISAL
jgi:hypothetical protein